MKVILFIILALVLSCSAGKYACYDCIQTKTTTWQRTYTCGKIDTVAQIDTLYHKDRCDNEKYIKYFEHNATHYCNGTKMICKLKDN